MGVEQVDALHALLNHRAMALLALPEFFLRSLALRYIARYAAQEASAIMIDGARTDLHIHQLTVLAPIRPLADVVASLLQDAPDVGVYASAVVRDEIIHTHPVKFLGCVHEELMEPRVCFQDFP